MSCVRACALETVLRDPADKNLIEDAVQRVHRVVINATEAITLVVQEEIEQGQPIFPVGEHGKVYAAFCAVVSDRRGSRPGSEHEQVQKKILAAFRRIHGANAPLVCGDGLGQLMKYESQFWIASMKTSLSAHYRRRVLRYCKLILKLPEADYRRLSANERLVQSKRALDIVTDICRPGWAERV